MEGHGRNSRQEPGGQEVKKKPWRSTDYHLETCNLLSLLSFMAQDQSTGGNIQSRLGLPASIIGQYYGDIFLIESSSS